MKELKHSIWVEKYRPSNIDEFVCDETFKDKIRGYIKENSIPHYVFHGDVGSGKTTLIKILSNELECDHLFLNASDENSIDVIREKVKNFVSSASFKPLKLVLLDEAANLSHEAQSALYNIIEAYSLKTRFLFTCNNIDKLTKPIKSRCIVYKLSPPSKGIVAERLVNILEKEKIKYNLDDIVKIVNTTYPDIRKSIGVLQDKIINNKLIVDKILISDYINQIITLINSKNTNKWVGVRQIICDNDIIDFHELYKALYEEYFENPNIVLILGEWQFKGSFGVDKEINTMSMIKQLLEELNKRQING